MRVTAPRRVVWYHLGSLVAARNDSVLWARETAVANEINENGTKGAYLPAAARLSDTLRATADLGAALEHAELLIVAIPSQSFRAVVTRASASIHPWIPVVSVTKGLAQGSLLRMTEIVQELLPGHPVAALIEPNIASESLPATRSPV